MNIFIVYAHPEPKSFDGLLKDRAVDLLNRDGHVVEVSDLYAMRFKAVADPHDFTDPQDPALFDLQREQRHAAASGSFAPDILAEQRKLLWSDLLILQFPLWWYGPPAMLKGWIDRVLAYGVAYGGGRSLSGRSAMPLLTTGGPPRPFSVEKQQVLTQMLDPLLRGTLHFCGMTVLPPYAVYGAAQLSQDQRESVLADFATLLHGIGEIPPLTYPPTP